MEQVTTHTASTVAHNGNRNDDAYNALVARIHARFLAGAGMQPLFTTSAAAAIWDTYLASFPESHRQYHNCSACRHFLRRYGALATIDDEGRVRSAVWEPDDATGGGPEAEAIGRLSELVGRAHITGVFLTVEQLWGDRITGDWVHFHLAPPVGAPSFHRGAINTAGQAMAEKRQDFIAVKRALADFSEPTLTQALRILEADALYRSEKVLGPAKWLADLHAASHGGQREALVWRAIAMAPAGFCHPRSSMVGTLLEDLAAGMAFDAVAARFKTKMHPLQYQRPQAAPKAGAIAQAEKIVAELGAAGSLARRFCRLDEVQAVWRPAPPATDQQRAAGVFSHLKPRDAVVPADITLPEARMTWEKFARTVLPGAARIELHVPHGRGSYGALVTAVNPDAPPILQWDTAEERNPVSWYLWHGGSPPEQFGLRSSAYHDLAAIALRPPMWGTDPERFAHHGRGLVLVIAGAQETRQPHACLFPENLKAEFHGIRSVIEAYSQSVDMAGIDEPHAAGLLLRASKDAWHVRLRVTNASGRAEYLLDRWD